MEHLKFKEGLSDTGKTKLIEVNSAFDNCYLGRISFLGRWRQYVYTPSGNDIIWSWECLEELKNKIIELNSEWKSKK